MATATAQRPAKKAPPATPTRASSSKPAIAGSASSAASALAALALPEPKRIEVALDQLHPHPANLRQTITPEDVAGMAQSLTTLGRFLHRLIVRPHPKKKADFEVIDGHRRRLGAGELPKSHPLRSSVPIDVYDLTDDQVAAVMLASRTQSRDLLPSEMLAGFLELAKHNDPDQIAAIVGQHARHVRGMLRLGLLPEYARAAMDSGGLPLDIAGQIARVPGDQARDVAARCVLVGQQWYRIGDKPPAIQSAAKEGFPNRLSSRATKGFIAQHLMKELKGARFDRTALNVLPNVPSCDECPKRAGNDPDAKAEGVRADVCLDPVCFREKEKNHGREKVRAAVAAGQKVLKESDARDVFDYSGSPRYGSGYVDLEGKDYHVSATKTIRQILGKRLDPAAIVVALDKEGLPHELLSDATYKRLKGGKVDASTLAPEDKKELEKEKQARAADREKNLVERETARATLAAGFLAADRLLKDVPDTPELRKVLGPVCNHLLSSAWGSVLEDMVARRDLAVESTLAMRQAIEKLVAEAEPRVMLATAVEYVLGRFSIGLGRDRADEKQMVKVLDLDPKALAEGTKAEVKAAKDRGDRFARGAGSRVACGLDAKKAAVKAMGLVDRRILEGGLLYALNQCGNGERWEKLRASKDGISDLDLKAQIGEAFGIAGGHKEPPHPPIAFRGGPDPAFWWGFDLNTSIGQDPTLKGEELVAKARALLKLGKPKATGKGDRVHDLLSSTPASGTVLTDVPGFPVHVWLKLGDSKLVTLTDLEEAVRKVTKPGLDHECKIFEAFRGAGLEHASACEATDSVLDLLYPDRVKAEPSKRGAGAHTSTKRKAIA